MLFYAIITGVFQGVDSMFKSIYILIFSTVLSFYLGLVIGSFIEVEDRPIKDIRSTVEISIPTIDDNNFTYEDYYM